MSEKRRGSSRPRNLVISSLSIAMITAGAVIAMADNPSGNPNGEDLSRSVTRLASFTTELPSAKSSDQNQRRVRLFKPQQNGMSLPAGNQINSNSTANQAGGRSSNTVPGYTGGVSNQRAGVRQGGPTTSPISERDKRDWMPMNFGNSSPNAQRIAQNNSVAPNNANTNTQNASLRNQQSLNQQLFGNQQQTRSQQPIGGSSNFGKTPSNTFGVSFPQNKQQGQTKTQAELDAELAARRQLLNQQQQQDEQTKSLRYQQWQQEEDRRRQQELFAKLQGGTQSNSGNGQSANGGIASNQANANAGTNSNDPFNQKLWNQNSTTNQDPFATSQSANISSSPSRSNQGYPNGFQNSIQQPGTAQTINVSANPSQTPIGQRQVNSQTRINSATTLPERDVDERLSPEQIARLPRTAWSYDRWGNPVTKGGRVLDQFGREVSDARAFELTWGREQRQNPGAGPFPNGASATQNPNANVSQTTQVVARPVSSPSDAKPELDRDKDYARDDDRRYRSAGAALQPKARSVSAQLFFNTLLLVSIIGNIYLAVWFQRFWGRYRDLVASQRTLAGPAVGD